MYDEDPLEAIAKHVAEARFHAYALLDVDERLAVILDAGLESVLFHVQRSMQQRRKAKTYGKHMAAQKYFAAMRRRLIHAFPPDFASTIKTN